MLASLEGNKYANEIEENIIAWRELMSRTHYSYAKSLGEKELCDYIKEKYGVEKLSLSTVKDTRDYISSGLLGDNFEAIDTVLRFIYKKGRDVSVNYDKKDKYVANSIKYLRDKCSINVIFAKEAQLVLPKRKYSFKSKVLHSRFVITVGMAIFPKGSKLRRMLKNKL